jgi:hypothetical protein
VGVRWRPGLEAQLAEMDTRVAALPDLRALHEKLTRTELASAIDTLAAQNDSDGLRELLLGVVDSARLVERRQRWSSYARCFWPS